MLNELVITAVSTFLSAVLSVTAKLLYADDKSISHVRGRTGDLVLSLNHDLANIYEWIKTNNSTINTIKTQAISLYHKVLTINILPLYINGGNIVFTNKVKNLAFIVNSQLNCNRIVNSTVQKMYFVLR